jgi:glucan biosynthesis protein
MKKFLFLLLNIAPFTYAETVPDYLKDGVITVTLKTGEIYRYSTNEYKVVKRGAKKVNTESSVVIDKENVKKENIKVEKNNVVLHFGSGFKGLNTNIVNKTVEVSERRKIVLGASYFRRIEDNLKLGVSGFTNGLITANVGLDY